MYDFIGQLSHSSADSSDIVYRVRHKASGQAYACKRISKHQAYGTYGGSAMRYTLPPLLPSTPLLHSVVVHELTAAYGHQASV